NFNPDIVIGTGGYVCGPVVFQATRRGIPTLIHEQNAFPGVTNKILSRYVDKVAITFKESVEYFKHPEKTILTGNPIRDELFQINRELAYKELKVDPKTPLILSFGGSGGQKALNDAILGIIKNNLIYNDFQLIHITGHRLYDDFVEQIEKLNIKLGDNIKILPYLYEMPAALNIADLIISSAGAITLAEISAVGIPSILIPKGYTAENHQEYNARAFEEAGASLVILEKDLEERRLGEKINKLLFDQDLLNRMAVKSKKIGKINAAEEIYLTYFLGKINAAEEIYEIISQLIS
ncbi:MAG TPA: UDP-N-acetylglucosamine--N-acetylmuramyl-(pentapeptide) pyrophosphoryl-undecaprenol N-acetylglucosamine transferase, partial [Tissierellaceae bacterium]|nr:UDP-N-acetylglucosamine--N-acetylmuramyl-(pentapeptide) pyrophosphoryl-undecaprenol N-acetylglucosamine transferase [Tissierellaceae bacterium]